MNLKSFDPLFFKSVLSLPSAPFREFLVAGALTQKLTQNGVPWCTDPVGNVLVGVSSLRDYSKKLSIKRSEPYRIFVAHMDHPGFHGLKFKSPKELQFIWHGGSPIKNLLGSKVWMAYSQTLDWSQTFEGQLSEVKMTKSGRAIESGTITLDQPLAVKIDPKDIFGGFKFREPAWFDGDLCYTKGADDLVGATSIVLSACQIWNDPKLEGHKKNFLGILTRAEEVGFIGALHHFNKGYLKKAKSPFVIFSLETSRTFVGAEIGKGPVVRLGDRTTVFSSQPLRVLIKTALQVLPEKHQKRMMDGGTCEGTPAVAFGYPTAALSVPLGNYHNQSFEGGPDSKGPDSPAPEFVSMSDVSGMLELCKALCKNGLDWKDPFVDKKLEWKKDLNDYRKLIELR